MRRRRPTVRPRHVEVLRLDPGDVVVYRSREVLDPSTVEAIAEALRDLFPLNRVAVLDAGASLTPIRVHYPTPITTPERTA